MSSPSISFDPQGYLLWFYVLVTLIALALVVLFYLRNAKYLPRWYLVLLVALRMLAVLVLILFIFRPALSFERSIKTRSTVMLLVDSSGSMSIPDGKNSPRRLERVKLALSGRQGVIRKLTDQFETLVFRFGIGIEQIAPAQLDSVLPIAEGTDIGGALRNVTAQRDKSDIAAVVLFTDGIDNSGRDIVPLTAELGVPVYPVGVGSVLGQDFKDIRVQDVDHKQFLVVDNVAEIDVFVEAEGYLGREGSVRLKKGDGVVAETSLALDNKKGPQIAKLKFIPKQKGRFTRGEYKIVVPADSDETFKENNTNPLSFIVADPKIKVLYVDVIRNEYKFLKRTLEMDPNVDLITLVKVKKDSFTQQGGIKDIQLTGFPREKDILLRFDAIVLGDIDRSFFDNRQLDALRAAVHEGTGFLMVGGEAAFGPGGYAGTPVEDALPVLCGDRGIGQERDPFQLTLTDEGLVHEVFSGVQEFFPSHKSGASRPIPNLRGCTRLSRRKRGATVLAEHPTQKDEQGNALIVVAIQTFGKGRTMAFAGDTTWQWYLQLRPLGRDSPYIKFWGQAVRWLASQKVKKEEPGVLALMDKPFYDPGEIARLFAHVRDDQGQATNEAYVEARVKCPSEDISSIQLPYIPGTAGEYEADFEPPGPGKYYVQIVASINDEEIGTGEVEFRVGKPNLEFQPPFDINEKDLKRIASASKGRYYSLLRVADLVDALRGEERRKNVPTEINLCHAPVLFIIFLCVVTSEWVLRKRRQLA